MQSPMLLGEILSAIAARVEHSVAGDAEAWIVTLTSVLVVLAAGGAAARVVRRLTRRREPELVALLNQSAAFFGRWPGGRDAGAPPEELRAEAGRCQRIIELLERRGAPGIDGGPGARGPIDGLHAWIALLHSQLQSVDSTPSGVTYA
jgi:hypothetical protein